MDKNQSENEPLGLRHEQCFIREWKQQSDLRQLSGVLERHERVCIRDGMRHAQQAGLHADNRKSTRLNSSHSQISYAVFCLKKKNTSIQLKNRATTACTAMSSTHLRVSDCGEGRDGLCIRRDFAEVVGRAPVAADHVPRAAR